MTKQSKKNEKYMEDNELDFIHIIIPKIVKKTFDLATRENDTDMSKAIRAFIHKYNSAYINKVNK